MAVHSRSTLVLAAWSFAVVLARPVQTRAEPPYSRDPNAPVQLGLVASERADPKIDVFIPQALVYGSEQHRSRYCSPWIRITNHSEDIVQTLVLQIAYQQSGQSKPLSTITVLDKPLLPHETRTFAYNPLPTESCDGIEGTVRVTECTLAFGGSCSKAIRVLTNGAILLQQAAKPKEPGTP